MMEIQPEIGSVVGQISDTKWGQVFLTPHAYGVVEVEEETGGAMKLGVSILSKLTQSLKVQPVSLHALDGIARLIEGRWIKTILLLVPIGPIVYLVLKGEGRVHLKRGDQLSRLLEKDGSLSGEVRKGDILLLASCAFARAITEESVLSVFDHSTVHEISEKMTLLLHKTGDGTGGAALVFEVGKFTSSESFTDDSVQIVEQVHISSKVRDRKIFKQLIAITRSRRPVAIISGVLIIFFVISMALGIQKQLTGKRNQEATRILNEARHLFEEGSALTELNAVKGRQRLTQAKDLLEPLAGSLSPRTSEGKEAIALFEQVNENLQLAMHSIKAEPDLFFDVSLIKNDARASTMALRGETLAIVDSAGRAVYALTLPSKNGSLVAGGDQFSGATLVALLGESMYTLTPNGIHKTSIREKKTIPLVVKKSDDWGVIVSMVTFGGNLYLLDIQKSRIWKYVATEEGFSSLNEYLNPDTLPDLSHGSSMAVDGSVWVATSDGKILRFTQGRENTYIISGIDPPLGSDLRVFVDDSGANVYVLDKESKRVVVLDKDGLYLAQYIWEADFQPTQFVVSEALKKILFLADGKIFSLELK